jgi:hypothetical protein
MAAESKIEPFVFNSLQQIRCVCPANFSGGRGAGGSIVPKKSGNFRGTIEK